MQNWEERQFEWIEQYMKMYDHASIQKQSYDFFIHHRLNKIVEEEPILETELPDGGKYRVKFGQVYVDRPYIIDENRNVRSIYPAEARMRELTYSSVVSVNIRVSRVKPENGQEIENKEYFKVMIARIPMMLGTSKCNLYGKTVAQRLELGECHHDEGGYFIIRGKERVLVSQERMNHNIVYVFEQKAGTKYHYSAEVRSMSDETGHSVLIQMKICQRPDYKIIIQIPYIAQEIPIAYLYRAYGFTKEDVTKMLDFHFSSTQKNVYVMKMRKMIERDFDMIGSCENAVQYIGQYSVHNTAKDKKGNYVHQILNNEMFPHLGVHSSRHQKGYFLTHMLHRVVMVYIGERQMDDRDHVCNKRIENGGILLAELFRTLFKRFVRAMEPQLAKRPDIMVVMSRLNLITQGIKHCFSTGNWGIPKSSYIRSGVSQILSRLTHNSFLSHLRRILIPIGKEGKNTKIRQIHPSQIGFICAHETPEGHCLTADTPILLEDGVHHRFMGDMSMKYRVLAIDRKSGKYESSLIHNYFRVVPKKLFMIRVSDGRSIRASGKHPFLVWSCTRREGVWVHAERLLVTDWLGCLLPRKEMVQHKKSFPRTLLFPKGLLSEIHCTIRDSWILRVTMDPSFLTSQWSYLPVFARLYGLISVLPSVDTSTIKIPSYVDDQTLLHDLRLCFPDLFRWTPTERLLESFFIHLCHHHIPYELFECPLLFRELMSGIISGINYDHVLITKNGFPINRHGLIIKNYRKTYHDEIFRRIQETWRKNNHDGWDMVTDDDHSIQLICRSDKKADFLYTYGMWYNPIKQRDMLLLSSYLLSDRKSFMEFSVYYRKRVRQHDNAIVFLPIDDLKQCVVQEEVMDFTTRSSFHAFIANGFVTHNSAGIVKNTAMMTQVSQRMDTSFVRSVLESMDGIQCNFARLEPRTQFKVFLNGIWIGCVEDGITFYQKLLRSRERRILSRQSSISIQGMDIYVFVDEGRMIRPLFEKTRLLQYIADGLPPKTMKELLDEEIVVFLDPHEIEKEVVAMTIEELMERRDMYTMCEIHPSVIMGLSVGLIPYVDHTQAPRVTYHASMGKQAIGYPISTNNMRSDTIMHMLWYPERPLVRTHYDQMTGCDVMATGNNLIVAIAMYSGFNQEDSVLFNQSAIDRGLFRSFCFRNVTIEERKRTTTDREVIGLSSTTQNRSYNYSKLDDHGVIKRGVFVGNGDVLVSRVQIKNIKTTMGSTEERSDSSVIVRSGEEGYVDKVFQSVTPDGYKIVKIKIRSLKIPEIGDKVASRSAQKGTIGMVFRHEDMPFTTSGLVPDLVINPLCIPSRMTINQLIECLGAKSSAYNGTFRLATAFSSHSTDIVDSL